MSAPPVVTLAGARRFPMDPEGGSERFGATVAPLGGALGLSGLGLTLIEVAPGKSAFPFHNHLANDEAFVILEGEGTYRFGAATVAVSAGMVCGAPRGGRETAHQLRNTGAGPLRYVAISTRRDPEVVEYPDSHKFAAIAVWPGESFMQAHLRFVGRVETSLDYWDGEEV